MLMKLVFPPQIPDKIQIPNFIEILPVGAQLFHADRQTDRRTDMKKLTVAFRNLVNAPKK
jgi:hypothetical protein